MDRPDAPDRAPGPEPLFDVLTDDGLDGFAELRNDAPVVPFGLHFGEETFRSVDLPLKELFERLLSGGPHPTTSQPSPAAYAEAYRAATRPLLVVTVSSALSGSFNAADQGRAQAPDAEVTLHDSGTISAAQAFQVHAALSARALGHGIDTALDWMRRVHDRTDFFFTLDSLTYLRRGGRIGRVQATLGSMLDLKPIVTVDKSTGAYVTADRARTWRKAIAAMAKQVVDRFGPDEPVRIGLVRGEEPDEAQAVLARIEEQRTVAWSAIAPVGAALAIHVGPKAVAYAVAPAAWPWEEDAPSAS
jgi:DegV family protein with EDD domain